LVLLRFSLVNAKVLLTHFANREVTHPGRISVENSCLLFNGEPIFHTITLAINRQDLRVMKQTIKQGCC
jgi:hypothetical protein